MNMRVKNPVNVAHRNAGELSSRALSLSLGLLAISILLLLILNQGAGSG
jgi:hypothetical protein